MARVNLRPFASRCKTFDSMNEAVSWAETIEAGMRHMRDTGTTCYSHSAVREFSCEEVLALPRSEIGYANTGVYFLFKKDKVVYVGQSIKLHQRALEHKTQKRNKKDFDSYSWVNCKIEELDTLERYYIDLLKPPLNISFHQENSKASYEKRMKLRRRNRRGMFASCKNDATSSR